ncbi:hypothetical protein [Streptomyces sp. NPDC052042]|uniref:hypothetical protein n=1 Tax=Streptomyces sp. NPDC052042 TaxID=3365683 RepID=UPI0037CE1A97
MVMWESEEFGTEHEGRPGVLLADGTEPGPVYFDAGSGSTVHRSTDWRVYDGTLGAPAATHLRGACSCGWRGTRHCPLDWEAADRRRPYLTDTTGPERDWNAHITDVQNRTAPVPAELLALLDQAEKRLPNLAAENPLAALRAVATLERLIRQAAGDAALSLDTPNGPSWDTIGQALGISAETARSRLTRYALGR